VPVAEPLSFGAAASRLVEVIDTQHAGIEVAPADVAAMRLMPVERQIVTTWIDLNCPLWDNYSPELHTPQIRTGGHSWQGSYENVAQRQD